MLMNNFPRIYKIVITQPSTYLQIGKQYIVAPTPYYEKATNQNGRYGVWVFARINEIIFVSFSHFLVVEYRFYPSPLTYGYVSSLIHTSGNAYWNNDLSRRYFIKLRNEYLNLE